MKNRTIIDTTRHDTTRHDRTSCPELSVIIPSILKDIDKLLDSSKFFFKYLPIKNIYVAAPENVREKVASVNDSRFIFMDEREFSDAGKIRELFLLAGRPSWMTFGWYVQQFIKMQFARFTQDEYYLIWDSDTVPVKPIKFFDDDSSRPFLDIKKDYYAANMNPYFETIKILFPKLQNSLNNMTFISEHMIIKTEYMRELIDEIESNSQFEGENFQEKIVNAMGLKSFKETSFSEFETYGQYIANRHPDAYIMREWRSLRHGGVFYKDTKQINEDESKWLSKYYDAVSLEKWSMYSQRFSRIVRSKLFMKIFSPKVFEYARSIKHLIRKIKQK